MSRYKEIISVINDDLVIFERELTEGINYPDNALFELINAPAKRIRAVLAILYVKMFAQNITNMQYNLLTAVELAHTASLIHDDIVDFDNKRREMQTISAKFGDKIGVLTGDYLLSLALQRIISLRDDKITEDFLNTFSNMAQGEINQFFSHGEIPNLDDYIKKTKANTAGLFCSALINSAKICGLNMDIAHKIGENFGIAFQIKNDLDNVLTTKTDINNGIYTAPVIFSKGIEVTQNGISQTKSLINEYIKKAEKALAMCPCNKYNEAIEDILELYKYD